MRVLMHRLIMPVMCVVLLLPLNMQAMHEDSMFGHGKGSEGPMGGEFSHNSSGPSMNNQGSHGPMSKGGHEMQYGGVPPGTGNNHSGPGGMSHPPDGSSDGNNSHSQKNSIPTHVVSGIDTDFKKQVKVDNAVDTINAKSGGNWLLKRVWWEKTEDVYEQIKEVFNKVMDTRMQFISDYNKLNRSLDIFYSEVGIEQGPLRDLLGHAQDLMNKEEKEQGYLNKREQAFVFKLKGKERDLEQLKLNVKAIKELDSKLDEAFEMLFKQIDVCNQYEQKAWDNFKEIARELNDKEARKLYYDTEGLYKDIQKVSEYISGAFASYFNQTIQSAHEHTSKISSQMNTLKNDGVDLVKEAQILEKDEEPEPKKVAPKTKKKVKKKGWWYNLGERFGRFIDSIVSLIPKSVRVWFGKEEKKVEAEYNEIKKEGEQDYDKIKKNIMSDVNSVEHDVHKKEKSIAKEVKHIQKQSFDYGDIKPEYYDLQQPNDMKPEHFTLNQPKPVSMPRTLPVPPTQKSHDSLLSMPVPFKKDPIATPVNHNPVHVSQPRRSITDHFTSPGKVSHKAPQNDRNFHEKRHSPVDSNHIDAFDPKTLNSASVPSDSHVSPLHVDSDHSESLHI